MSHLGTKGGGYDLGGCDRGVMSSSHRRETAQRAILVEILSAATQLYEKSPFKSLAICEWPWRWLKVIGFDAIRWAIV